MELLQRVALIVRPKHHYVEWANHVDSLSPRLNLADVWAHPSIYLINAAPERALADEQYALEIFENELEAWTTDETKWPADRTALLFHAWFEVVLADQLWDVDAQDPMFDDEVPDECGWCGQPLGEGDAVVTITLVRSPDAPTVRPGPLRLPVAGRVISAMVPVRDSVSGRHGAGALILLCSEDCASRVRTALSLQRAPFNSRPKG